MVNELRVWEETWEQEGVLLRFAPLSAIPFTPASEHNAARTRLAAKAPEMARMLMLLAGMGSDPYCNGCGDTSKRGHTRDCALVKLLFEAGVGEVKQADRSPCLALVKP